MVKIFEMALNKKVCYKLANKGAFYDVDTHKIHAVRETMGLNKKEEYNYNLIQKYYGRKSKLFL